MELLVEINIDNAMRERIQIIINDETQCSYHQVNPNYV